MGDGVRYRVTECKLATIVWFRIERRHWTARLVQNNMHISFLDFINVHLVEKKDKSDFAL